MNPRSASPARQGRGPTRRRSRRTLGSVGRQRPLYRADDNGNGVRLFPKLFGGNDAEGWGRAFDSFQRLNEPAFEALSVTPRFDSTPRGPELTLYPGGAVGAIPLRSGTSGQVVAGFVVRPRFGWAGVGSVLSNIGWHAAPNILSMPLVPGSGREVPPWVLAGPGTRQAQGVTRCSEAWIRFPHRHASRTTRDDRVVDLHPEVPTDRSMASDSFALSRSVE